MIRFLGFLFLFLFVGGLQAQCRTVYHSTYVQHTPYVQTTPVYIAQFLPVLVPTYNVGYVGQQAPASDPSLLKELQTQKEEIEALRKALLRSQTPVLQNPDGTTLPPQKLPSQSGLKKPEEVFIVHCSSCHEQKVAANKGGGLALLNGETLLQIPDAVALRIIDTCYSGEMPKGKPPLPDADFALIMKWNKQRK